MPEFDTGTWSDLEAFDSAGAKPDPELETKRCFVRAFESNPGAVVLAELRKLYLDRDVQPTQTDAELRHMEGQRSVVRHIMRQIEAGKK